MLAVTVEDWVDALQARGCSDRPTRRGESNPETRIWKRCCDRHLRASERTAWRPAWRRFAVSPYPQTSYRRGPGYRMWSSGTSWMWFEPVPLSDRCHKVPFSAGLTRHAAPHRNRYDFSRRAADAKSLLNEATWRQGWLGRACVVPDGLLVEARF